MDVGKLDRKILIESKTMTGQNGMGEPNFSWTQIANTWAEMEFKNAGSKEDVQADQITSVDKVYFTIRHRTGIQAKDRVTYDNVIYEIENVRELTEMGRKCFLELRTIRVD